MDTIYFRCAGLDVHKQSVEATIRLLTPAGRLRQETRRFGTMTADLEALGDWLAQAGVTHVAMESTGVYWKPVFNVLEDRFTLLLVNARHVKQVPGRKTDALDSQWLAQLLQHGLLRASFVPPRDVRELRDLTRQRTQLVRDVSRVANRIQKVLEDANIKLASVASDVLGVTGRAILQGLIDGRCDPEALADEARGRLRAKRGDLTRALHGHVTEHHRFQLRILQEQLLALEELIGELDRRIGEKMQPHEDKLQRLDEIPGVNRRVAEALLAETGPDMRVFGSPARLASWAGMCPGNQESAGKRLSGRTRKGSVWLRATLSQAAWAAGHAKKSYLGAQYRRLAARRGRKRAAIAVGHSVLRIAYVILAGDEAHYRDLGPEHFDRLEPARLTRYLVKRLEKLGHKVTLQDANAA